LKILFAMKAPSLAKPVLDSAKSTPSGALAPQDQSVNSPPPSAEEVAYRAYLNFQNHGSAPGHDVEDWLRAEAELEAERSIANSI